MPEETQGGPTQWEWPKKLLAWAADQCCCLPAVGVALTAVLLLLVSWSLLSKFDLQPETAKKLKIRIFSDKQGEDKKAGQKQNDPPFREAGTLEEAIKQYETRRGYLDIRGKQLAFLSIWAAVNLLQAVLTIVVLVLSVTTIVQFTPWYDWKQTLGLSAIILIVTVGLVVLIDLGNIVHLRLNDSLLAFLQDIIQQNDRLNDRVNVLTRAGNFSVALVAIVTPLSVGVLLRPAANAQQRLDRFQQLTYWTTSLLVVGVIQVTYQSRWPSLLFDDDTSIQSIAQMAAGAGLLVGGVFTVAAGLVFLPAGFLLHSEVVGASPAPATAHHKSWLTEIVAILAPAVTALPVAKLFDIIR